MGYGGYVNPCFLREFPCFPKLMIAFPQLWHGLRLYGVPGTIWSCFGTLGSFFGWTWTKSCCFVGFTSFWQFSWYHARSRERMACFADPVCCSSTCAPVGSWMVSRQDCETSSLRTAPWWIRWLDSWKMPSRECQNSSRRMLLISRDRHDLSQRIMVLSRD